MSVAEPPRAVHCVTAPGHCSSTKHAEQTHVVLNHRNPGRGAVPDQRLQGFDVPITLRTVAKHNCRMLFFVDMAGSQKWSCNAINADTVLFRQLAKSRELFPGRV